MDYEQEQVFPPQLPEIKGYVLEDCNYASVLSVSSGATRYQASATRFEREFKWRYPTDIDTEILRRSKCPNNDRHRDEQITLELAKSSARGVIPKMQPLDIWLHNQE